MTGGSSSETKERARKSLLTALARSDVEPHLPPRPQLALSVARFATIVVSLLTITAGAAAAAGANFSSVPGRVVDVLMEPLPLSAKPMEARLTRPTNQGATNDAAGDGTRDGGGGHGAANEVGAYRSGSNEPAAQHAPDVIEATGTNLPVEHVPDASVPNPPRQPDQHEPAPADHPTPTPHPAPPHPNPPGNGGHPQDGSARPQQSANDAGHSPADASANPGGHSADHTQPSRTELNQACGSTDQSTENALTDPHNNGSANDCGPGAAGSSESPTTSGGNGAARSRST